MYQRYLLPRLVDRVCAMKTSTRQRQRVVPQARGDVLEVGFGTGLNLPWYDADSVQRLWALEPAAEFYALSAERRGRVAFPIEYLACSATAIPLADQSVDSVVVTFTLCTIPDVERALAEMRRVLRDGGILFYCEHGLATDTRVRHWQQRLTPAWRRIAGGCHLDRDIAGLIAGAGFRMQSESSRFLPGWRPANYHYWGEAR